MITQSGSEGISLKNVRQVHLVEPYWNMIRMDQVIGRAARTGSHLALPKKDRNIDVYRYLCKFSDKQLEERKIQRMDNGKTTDEIIHEGAERKAKITNQILELLKSSAVDCYLHKKNHQNVTCFSYPINIDDNELSVEADIYTDLENLKNKNKEEIKLSVSVVSIKNKKYAILKDSPKAKTGQLFDYETYVQFGNLEFVGLLEMNNENKLVLRLKK
jgi:superfamily II DNA or RNA helicase